MGGTASLVSSALTVASQFAGGRGSSGPSQADIMEKQRKRREREKRQAEADERRKERERRREAALLEEKRLKSSRAGRPALARLDSDPDRDSRLKDTLGG